MDFILLGAVNNPLLQHYGVSINSDDGDGDEDVIVDETGWVDR